MSASNYVKWSHGGTTHFCFSVTDDDLDAQLARARAATRSANWTHPPDVVVFRATYRTRHERHVLCCPTCVHPCIAAGEMAAGLA